MEEASFRSYEKDSNAWVDITVEMNFSEKLISRAGYTFLDYLSDIGGMQGLLISGVSYFVSFWNYNYFDNYMVTRLFKIKKKKCQDVDNCE